ncbi:chromosome segregation SMC family protein [Sphingomonas sp.]|uniref:chromosome segregation SMC family protein n=1 Tax=Sphingomonas sp. TaxID=28214 RepID=UPI0035BBC84E
MKITRLRIAGFKSFVEATELRIEPGLTGVVGPNGCGKSNLLEALRWTMGETSARSLRGAGMDDVIFAGTATRPPRDFAEVSILGEVAGDEREVVRRIERGAGSAYRIDGRDVRARDVALLFADAATGAHSPALVSQGRIGAVIAARPADRRAMLEEASGIAGLHVRRREAEARLRATEVNLERLDTIIADQDARAAALKRQARAAAHYRELSAQVRVAEARMIYARWRDAAAAADTARTEATAAERAVAQASEAERTAAAMREAAAEAVAIARTAALATRDAAGEIAQRLAATRAERAEVDRRLAAHAADAARLVEDRAREGALAGDAADAIRRLGDEAKALDAQIAAARPQMTQLDANLAQAERSARDAEVALAQALARQATETADARVARVGLTAAQARADRAERDAAQLAAAREALGDPAPLAAARDAAIAARRAAEDEATTARTAIAQADADERSGAAARDAAEAARATAHATLAALDAEAKALRTAVPQGGRDRLLDHVAAAPGYERALAAALDDALDTAPTAWTGAEPHSGDPPLPPGTAPLAPHVKAPATLARRLAQVFVTDTDDGIALAVGQRLVTRDGHLRRWDGYRAQGGGAAAADRLQRANHLAALDTARPAAVAAASETQAARDAVAAQLTGARSTGQAARAALSRAETALRDAGRAEDRATAALERRAGQQADLDVRAARTAEDRVAALADVRVAERSVAALPDGEAATIAVAERTATAAHTRATVADARAARTALDRTTTAAAHRLASVQAEARSWRTRAGEAAKRIAAMDTRAATVARDAAALADRPAALDTAVASLDAAHTRARAQADSAQTAERTADVALRTADDAYRAASEPLAAAREVRAGALARVENQELRRVEMGRLSGERFECPAPVLPERTGFAADTVATPQTESATHERLARDRERIGPVNLVAERELAEMEAASTGNTADRDELSQAVHRLRGAIGTLNREGRQRLLAAFEAVDAHFRRLFATLFDGGEAHLELVDSDDPLEAGLEIMAQPPGKRLQSLTLLSGGEQALTAIALIFALFLTNPAPICVLDEVDAPLDDANIERFCDLLAAMARDTDTRYLVVTHNAVTMSRMHRLFGVTMIERGVSRLVSVDLQAAEILAG